MEEELGLEANPEVLTGFFALAGFEAFVFPVAAAVFVESCANPLAGNKQTKATARTQAAPNHPVAVFVRCFGANGNLKFQPE